jgi:hypothetical protein
MKPLVSIVAAIPFFGIVIVSAILALKEWPLGAVSNIKKGV